MNKTEMNAWLISRGCTKTRRFIALLSSKNQHKVFGIASPEFVALATTSSGRPRAAGTDLRRLLAFATSRRGTQLSFHAVVGWHVRGWVTIETRRPHHQMPKNLAPPSTWSRVELTDAGVAACAAAIARATKRGGDNATRKKKPAAKKRKPKRARIGLRRTADKAAEDTLTPEPVVPASAPLLEWRPPPEPEAAAMSTAPQ